MAKSEIYYLFDELTDAMSDSQLQNFYDVLVYLHWKETGGIPSFPALRGAVKLLYSKGYNLFFLACDKIQSAWQNFMISGITSQPDLLSTILDFFTKRDR